MRRDSLDHVINVAINQTLGRTIITSGTALLSSLALFFFGGEVLHGFAFTMMVGIITGTYSTRVHRRGDRQLLARQPGRRGPRRTRRRRADRAAAADAQVEAAAESARVVELSAAALAALVQG